MHAIRRDRQQTPTWSRVISCAMMTLATISTLRAVSPGRDLTQKGYSCIILGTSTLDSSHRDTRQFHFMFIKLLDGITAMNAVMHGCLLVDKWPNE